MSIGKCFTFGQYQCNSIDDVLGLMNQFHFLYLEKVSLRFVTFSLINTKYKFWIRRDLGVNWSLNYIAVNFEEVLRCIHDLPRLDRYEIRKQLLFNLDIFNC